MGVKPIQNMLILLVFPAREQRSGRYARSFKLDDPSFNATICAKLIEETKLRGTIRRA